MRCIITSFNPYSINPVLLDKANQFNLCLKDFIKSFEHLSSINNTPLIIPKYDPAFKTYYIPKFHKSEGWNPEHYEKYKDVHRTSVHVIHYLVYELTRLANVFIKVASQLGFASSFSKKVPFCHDENNPSYPETDGSYIKFPEIVKQAKTSYLEEKNVQDQILRKLI